MRAVLFLFAVVLAVALAQDAEQKAKILEIRKKCIDESKTTEAQVDKTKQNDWTSTDPTIKKYVHCYLQTIGAIDSKEVFQKDVFLNKLPKETDKDKARTIIEECLKQPQVANHDEATWNICRCYFAKDAFRYLI